MCGRYAFFSLTPEDLEFFGVEEMPADFSPRYNIAPTQVVPVISNQERTRFSMFRWGLIPSWAKDAKIGNKLINARAETLAEKPSFRSAYKRKRCLVPADGFYEWKKTAGAKVPHFIRMKSGKPMALAGLWERWQPGEENPLHTFTIITTTPNDLVGTIHNRMPAILRLEDYETWLNPGQVDAASLAPLLGPLPADEMEAHPVSTMVNSPARDSAEIIQAV